MSPQAVQLPACNRVFQRANNGTGRIPFVTQAPVQARVTQGGKTIVGWHTSKGVISGVPTGGPYSLEVKTPAGEVLSASGLLIGDLWILAGQSNMDGCGKLIDTEPPSKIVHNFYYSETWDIAKDPLCVLVDSIDPVHWPCEEEGLPEARRADHLFRETGAGMGVRFGKELHKATGVPIGLISCSHGGTSIEQWSPKKKRLGGHSLYGSMLRRVNACGGAVTGVLWYQGESNANPNTAGTYKARMKAFIETVRRDLNAPKLPFIQVQISRVFSGEAAFVPECWNGIQRDQLELALEMRRVATAAAIDCSLSDTIHIDAASGRLMGRRLAELALVLAYKKKAPLTIHPTRVSVVGKARDTICVTYKNVRGSLKPAKGVRGFYVEDGQGGRVAVLAAVAKGNTVTLTLEKSVGKAAQLWYGRGLNPATNLRDSLFAAPVFGPVNVT